MTTATRFEGFPAEAFRFYEQLAKNNAKPWWEAHKATYLEACQGPMEALLAELEPEFGEGRVMRPYRDVRFSADKSPYKTNCSAHAGRGGWLQLAAEGFYVGGGAYAFEGPALTRYRDAVAAEASGAELARIVATLERRGYEVGGEALKSAPRGYAADHPRIALLRRKGLHAGRLLPVDAMLQSRKILATVQKALRDVRPLVEWLDAHVGTEGRM